METFDRKWSEGDAAVQMEVCRTYEGRLMEGLETCSLVWVHFMESFYRKILPTAGQVWAICSIMLGKKDGGGVEIQCQSLSKFMLFSC